MAIWQKSDLTFDFEADLTAHPVVTLLVETAQGRLHAMAEPIWLGRVLILVGFHIHGDITVTNDIGPANLIALAQALMEVLDVDELVVAAGLRTTGASPGSRARRVRFTRRPAA